MMMKAIAKAIEALKGVPAEYRQLVLDEAEGKARKKPGPKKGGKRKGKKPGPKPGSKKKVVAKPPSAKKVATAVSETKAEKLRRLKAASDEDAGE